MSAGTGVPSSQHHLSRAPENPYHFIIAENSAQCKTSCDKRARIFSLSLRLRIRGLLVGSAKGWSQKEARSAAVVSTVAVRVRYFIPTPPHCQRKEKSMKRIGTRMYHECEQMTRMKGCIAPQRRKGRKGKFNHELQALHEWFIGANLRNLRTKTKTPHRLRDAGLMYLQ